MIPLGYIIKANILFKTINFIIHAIDAPHVILPIYYLVCIHVCIYSTCTYFFKVWQIIFKVFVLQVHVHINFLNFLAEFPNSVSVRVNRFSKTKLRRQVKQARLPTKMAVALGLYIYYKWILVLLGWITAMISSSGTVTIEIPNLPYKFESGR